MLLRAALISWLAFIVPAAAEWRADIVPTSGQVAAIDVDGTIVLIAVGPNWYQLTNDVAKLVPATPPDRPRLPRDALPDGRRAVGTAQVARAWLAAPTSRYDHGVLGDAVEAGSLVIERRDGRHGRITLGHDAVFEDLSPRIASIDGRDWIVVVKSYLDRGSALAVIDTDSMTIAAETPPIGHSHAWLNPAGIADYDGNGTTDIALVRQPHVVGRLELWSWKDRKLTKTVEIADVANHFIGSRAIGMSWTADFDGDGRPDLAVPSLDRRTLRIIGFAPEVRDIARVRLPARIATNIGAIRFNGKLALIAGVEDGRLILIRNQ
jgi:FG-GAP-like repeat